MSKISTLWKLSYYTMHTKLNFMLIVDDTWLSWLPLKLWHKPLSRIHWWCKGLMGGLQYKYSVNNIHHTFHMVLHNLRFHIICSLFLTSPTTNVLVTEVNPRWLMTSLMRHHPSRYHVSGCFYASVCFLEMFIFPWSLLVNLGSVPSV